VADLVGAWRQAQIPAILWRGHCFKSWQRTVNWSTVQILPCI